MAETAPWSGSVQVAPGRLAFTGELGPAHAHAHAAVQVLVVTAGSVVLSDERGARLAVRAAVIPPGAGHTMHAERATGTTVYLDPTGRDGRAAAARVPVEKRLDVRGWAAAGEQLAAAGEVGALGAVASDIGALRAVASDIGALGAVASEIGALGVGGEMAVHPVHRGHPVCPAIHPALREAVASLPALLAGPVLLSDVASRVGLSAGRLRHLFTEQLGLPFTAYVRWARLRAAMGTVLAGGTLTEAAHAAGFTDSAHLTRVVHAMFGLTPSEAARGLRGR